GPQLYAAQFVCAELVDDAVVGNCQRGRVRRTESSGKVFSKNHSIFGIEYPWFEPRLSLAIAYVPIHARRNSAFAFELLGDLHVWPRSRVCAGPKKLFDSL